jgi:hypothetical protein
MEAVCSQCQAIAGERMTILSSLVMNPQYMLIRCQTQSTGDAMPSFLGGSQGCSVTDISSSKPLIWLGVHKSELRTHTSQDGHEDWIASMHKRELWWYRNTKEPKYYSPLKANGTLSWLFAIPPLAGYIAGLHFPSSIALRVAMWLVLDNGI